MKWIEHLRSVDWALGAILLLGGVLRFWGINFGLPYTYASDEPNYLITTLQIVRTGDLNPHWWLYPSLMFYLYAGAMLIYFLVGRLLGFFVTPADLPDPEIVTMGVGKLALPEEFLVTRGLNALFSVAAMFAIYWIARRLHPNKWVARLAVFLFAISPTVVDHSHRMGPDIFAMFFSLISFYCVTRIVDDPKLSYYVGAGIGAGLAIASKYNAGLILVPLLVVHLLRFRWTGWARKELYAGLAATAFAFFAAVPFSVFDFWNFWEGVRWQAYSYTIEGHAGQEGDALQWYVTYLFSVEGWSVVLAVLCGFYFLFARSTTRWVLLSFPLTYFMFVSMMFTRNARTIMLIIPFLVLLAAILIVDCAEWLIHVRRWRRQVVIGLLVAISALLIIPPLQMTIAANIRLTQPDGRESARQWLEANLPAGTRVALEAYSPYLDTQRYVVYGIDAIVDRRPEWYMQNGFEYLVFSQGMYGRFFAEPQRYSTWIAKYNEFFARFPKVQSFNDNGYEVRIYQTNTQVPPHRVAVRFGDYGEHLELIGYDDVQWTRGEPLRARVFWRMLGDKSEPFEVELRLLDTQDRELARARYDLFQGKGWRAGMFDEVYTLSVPTDVPPDVYRLQVNVIWTRYAYHLPAFSWGRQRIDPVILQHIGLR